MKRTRRGQPKKIFLVIAVILAATIVCYYFIPRITPIDFTFSVVKINSKGEIVGNHVLHIRGNLLDHPLTMDQLLVKIDPLDGIIFTENVAFNYVRGGIDDFPGTDLLRAPCGSIDYATFFSMPGMLYFSKDLDRWLLWIDDRYYMGSVSGNYTTEELIEYFIGFLPEALRETA